MLFQSSTVMSIKLNNFYETEANEISTKLNPLDPTKEQESELFPTENSNKPKNSNSTKNKTCSTVMWFNHLMCMTFYVFIFLSSHF